MSEKILFVFRGEGASGAEIVIERLIAFNKRNIDAHVFIAPCPFGEALAAKNIAAKVIVLEELKSLNRSQSSALGFYFKALKNYLLISIAVYRYGKKNGIKIIHANTIVPAIYLLPALLFSKIFARNMRWIWSDHDLGYYSNIDTKLSSICVSLYNRTLAVSQAVKNKYVKRDKVDVLYNGLDLDAFTIKNDLRTLFRRKYKLDNHIAIGLAGMIAPRKGQLELIQAFKSIAGKMPLLTLIFVGKEGKDDDKYVNIFKKEVSLHNQIMYLEKISDMPMFYNGCDIIVNNSSQKGSEPLGTTIYEGMACERIVMASNTGGTPEIITYQLDGFIFNPDDVRDLINKLTYIIENFDNLSLLRQRARVKVAGKFNIQTMAATYGEILKNL